jgi:hypothetical protein
MNKKELLNKVAGIVPWKANYGDEMEYRTADGVSWYDLSVNCNSLPCEPEIAVIVTAWFGQLKWLKATLESYRKSGAFVILSYDNPFYSWIPRNDMDMIRCMPNMKHYMLANSFVMKHLTYDGNKRNGWFWNVRYAQGIIKQFPNIKYVYCTNGDCVIEKPEGFKDVINLLGENDLISGQSTESVIHTADVFYKINAFNSITDYMFEIMRIPVIGSHSPEVMLRESVVDLNLKVLHAPKQPLDKDGSVDMYARYNPDSTWKDLLGFRNIFAEYETLGNEGKEPLDKKFVDDYGDWLYWSGDEKETICKYWETGDRRYIKMWWDRWEDSDYNRLYYPIEFYGKEPIYKE